MPKVSQQQRDAELMPANEPLPEGTRQVQRTTVERFTTAPASEGNGHAAAIELPDDELGELEELPGADREPSNEETLSPVERLLHDFNHSAGSGGPVVIYAKRKPDPVGMSFRNPCNVERACGEVPYDETDVSIEAIELAIQKLYGGGRYQIVLRQNGNYAGAKTLIIADPPEKQIDAPAPAAPAAPTPAAAPRSSLEEVKSSVAIVREVAELLNAGRPEPRVLPPSSPTPVDPLETMRGAINLVKEVNSFSNPVSNNGGDGETSAVRDWTEGIAGIFRELQIGSVINNLLVYGLRAAEQKRAQQENGANTKNDQVAAEDKATAPESQPASDTSYPPLRAVDAPPPNVPQLPGGFNIEQLPPPMRVALDHAISTLVSELQNNETSDADEYSTDAATDALESFLEKYPLAAPIFDQFLSQSSVRLVLLLSSLKPEWSNLPDFDSASGFLDEVKAWWNEAKENANGSSQTEQTEVADIPQT